MKLTSFLTLASVAVSAAFAIQIGYPTPNTTIAAGQNITVQVELPDTIASIQTISIAIGFLLCPMNVNPCPPPSQQLGNVVFTGPFNPQFPPLPTTQDIPQQNYTVQVPSGWASGSAVQLGAGAFMLVGGGPSPTIQYAQVPLIMQ